MRENKFKVLAVLGLLIVLGMGQSQLSATPSEELAPGVSTEHRFPLAITGVSVSAEPAVGRIVVLEIQITSSRTESDVGIRVELPPEVNLVTGDTFWQGSLEENRSYSHTLWVMVSAEGTWPIRIRTVARSLDRFRYADIETVRLESTLGSGNLIRERDFVVRQPVVPGHEPEFSLPRPTVPRAVTALEAGQIQIRGRVRYDAIQDDGPSDVPVPNQWLGRVVLKLWDQEGGVDRLLAETQAGPTGDFLFDPVSNDDSDGTGIDPYIEVYATDNTGPGPGRVRVLDANDQVYRYADYLPADQPDGVLSWQTTIPESSGQAFYIFDKTANLAYDYLEREVAWGNGDLLDINWPRKCLKIIPGSSCFVGEIYLLDSAGKQPDVIIHEYGHFVLSRYADVTPVVLACAPVGFNHELFAKTVPTCAWSEGWADFLEMAVQGDPDYVGSAHEDVELEIANVEAGQAESYEFIVAAALWDILDSSASPSENEAFDQFFDGFNGPAGNGIWHFSTADFPRESHPPLTIRWFWQRGWLQGRPDDACYGSLILQHYLLPYEPFAYSLTTLVQPPGTGSISVSPGPNCPDSKYSETTVVALNAQPRRGYIFNRWFGVDSNPTRNPASVTVNRDRTVTARFGLSPGARGFDPATFTATFYNGTDLTGTSFTRPYAEPIDFLRTCWDEGPPYAGCKLVAQLDDGNDYSVRWNGRLLVPASGEYVLIFANVDDSARLFLDGVERADNGWYWPAPDRRPSPRRISLTAGWHNIRVDYEQRVHAAASLQLRWSGPGFDEEVIPLAGSSGVGESPTVLTGTDNIAPSPFCEGDTPSFASNVRFQYIYPGGCLGYSQWIWRMQQTRTSGGNEWLHVKVKYVSGPSSIATINGYRISFTDWNGVYGPDYWSGSSNLEVARGGIVDLDAQSFAGAGGASFPAAQQDGYFVISIQTPVEPFPPSGTYVFEIVEISAADTVTGEITILYP